MDRAAEALHSLRESLLECQACGLCAGRTQVVFGAGSPAAKLMFVGEGPGFHEDRQGEPFVGQAGKLLTTLLATIGLSRADVYIANVVKCRPPDNRDPTAEEIAACSPHLMRQIAIIRPRVICTLGRFATKLLTGTELSMTAVHGKAKAVVLGDVETVAFPVYHPAAALYTPANRVVLEEDFAKLRRLLERGLEAVRVGGEEGGGVNQGGEPVASGASVGMPPMTENGETAAATSRPQALGREASGNEMPEQLPLW